MFQPPPPGAAAGAPRGGPQMMQAPPPPGGPQMMQAPPPPGGAGGLQAPASSPFYQQPPSQGQQQRAAAPAPPGGMPGGPATPIFNENIDFNIKIPDRLFRLTAGKLPQTASQATASKIPFGAVLQPLAPAGPDEEEIDTVQPGNAGIIRCKRCRTYINAFVTWSEHGRRWRCNICAQVNDCPSAYFCHLDEAGMRRDRFERPELSQGVVEFIAPAEYMVRPPQEPTFFFVLDVSATAVRSGMLQSAAKAIKESLDDLPGRGRTKIGFITFDNSVHYYNLASDLSNPQMLVVSDLKELFVPLPDNLLVNLQESRGVVDAFLDSLPEMFAKAPVVSQSCLGPALKAAFTVMKQIGGKMCVFQSIMPNLGDGALKPREQPGIMGTPNEVKVLRPECTWYKDTAVEFSRQQISVDMFLFPYQYMDLAALGELPKYTAGTLHSYVSFDQQRDGQRFEEQLNKTLTQPTIFEAVMRIRCTKGMRITNFFGNFYIRGTDLLALPNSNTDSVFGFDLVHDDQNIASNYVTVQAALLYTSSDGERRIRVMTQAIPVTSLTSEVVASLDTDVICALLAKQALQSALKSSLDNARMRLQQTCVEIIRAAKGGDKRTVSGYAVPPSHGGQQQGGEGDETAIPENLKLLPLYTLALMKNVAFRGGTDVHPDERVQAHHILNGMSVLDSKRYIYPRMFAIHEMDEDMGHPLEEPLEGEDENLTAGRDHVLLPPVVSLTIEGLTSDGIYLLDNGVEMFLWVGRTAVMTIVSSLFGTHTLEEVDPNQVSSTPVFALNTCDIFWYFKFSPFLSLSLSTFFSHRSKSLPVAILLRHGSVRLFAPSEMATLRPTMSVRRSM
jgi:protein transport protein SEC24